MLCLCPTSSTQLQNYMFAVHYIWLQGWEYAPEAVRKRIDANRPKWVAAGATSIELWDEARISALLAGDKQTLLWFKGLQTTIAKCDVGRAFVLQHHGGIYADADFDPEPMGVKQLWQEAQQRNLVLLPADKSMGFVNNYLIASPRGSKFWNHEYIPAVAAAIESPPLYDAAMALLRPTWPVLSTHGPILISRLCSKEGSHAAAATIPSSDLGFHGWNGGDSAWYKTRTERFQRRVALVVLLLATWGVVLTLYLLSLLLR